MDPTRTRTPPDRHVAARRRLEILGAQLGAAPGESVPRASGAGDSVGLDILDARFDLGDPEAAAATATAAATGEPVRAEEGRRGRHRARRLTRGQRWSGDVHDRLPGHWQSLFGRGLTAQHLVVVVAVVAVAACLTGWWVISASPSEVEPLAARASPATAGPGPSSAATAGPATSSTAPSGTGPAGAASSTPAAGPGAMESGDVVVDVSGKVRKPGIVTLPAGSRVADAVDAAGGARRGVEFGSVNLARVLVDGEQIVVGLPPVSTPASGSSGGAGVPASGATPAAPINLNAATQEQLETLPGVGPVTATAILSWRTEHGRFSSVDELLEVDGIGDATLADLRDLVTV